MPIATLLLLFQFAQGQWPVVISANFSGIQLAYTDNVLSLAACAVGYDLTYDLTGTYTPVNGPDSSELKHQIFQKLAPAKQYLKPVKSVPNPDIGFIYDEWNEYYYSANENTLYALDFWYINFNASPYFASINLDFPILSIVLDNSNSYGDNYFVVLYLDNGGLMTYQPITLSGFSLKLKSGLTKSKYKWTQIITASSTLNSYQSTVKCIFVGRNLANTLAIVAEELSLGGKNKEEPFTHSPLDLSFGSYQPFSVVMNGDNSFFCFKESKILAFSTSSLFSNKPDMQRLSIFDFSEQFFECTITSEAIIVSGIKGQYFYYYEESNFVDTDILPASPEQSSILASSQFANSGDLYALIVQSNTYASFRLLNTTLISSIVMDVDMCAIAEEICGNVALPLMLIELFDYTAVVIEAESSLYVSIIQEPPGIKFPAGLEYKFQGELSVSSSGNRDVTPVLLQTYNPNSANIYSTRNTMPSDGYLQSEAVFRALNSEDAFFGRVYVPLSNYFSGHFLLYNMTVVNGYNESVSIETPPIFTSSSENNTYDRKSTPLMEVIEFQDNKFFVLANDDTVYIYSCIGYGLELIRNVSTNSNYAVTRLAKMVTYMFTSDDKQIDVGLVLIESMSESDSEGYFYNWDLVQLGNYSESMKLNSKSFNISTPHHGLQTEGSVFIVYADNKFLFTGITEIDGIFQFTDTWSNNMTGEYYPLKDFTEDNYYSSYFYALDSSCSLYEISIYSDNGYLDFQSNCSDPNQGEALVLPVEGSTYYLRIDPSSTASLTAYPVFEEGSSISYYPKLVEGQYLSAEISVNYLFVLLADTPSNKLLVYDNNAATLRNLVTIIDLGSATSIVVSNVSAALGQYTVFAYDGYTLQRFFVGQKASAWSPSSDLVPATNTENTVWGRVTFRFKNLENTLNHFVSVMITARSGIDNTMVSQEVTVGLNNTGSFIMGNSSGDYSSLLRRGYTFEVTNSSLEETVPIDHFAGADINYGLIVNKRFGTPLLPSELCDSTQFVACVKPKCVAQNLNLSDTDENYAVYGGISLGEYIYYISDDTIFKVSDDYTVVDRFNLSTYFYYECNLMQAVKNSNDSIVVVCQNGYSSPPAIVTVINAVSGPKTPYDLTFTVASMSAGFESGNITIFLTSQRGIDVLTFSDDFDTQSTITAFSLGRLSFTPVSLAFFNDSCLFVCDTYSNSILVLKASNNEYSVDKSSSIVFHDTSQFTVVEIALTEDNQYLFAMSANTTVLQFLVDPAGPSMTLERVASPVDTSLDKSHPSKTMTLSPSGQLVSFFLYENEHLSIRVVNFSAPEKSEILTTFSSFLKPDQTLEYTEASLQLLSDNGDEVRLLAVHRGFTKDYEIIDKVWNVTVTPRVKLTFFPYSNVTQTNNNITFQLLAYNVVSRWIGPVFFVYYPE